MTAAPPMHGGWHARFLFAGTLCRTGTKQPTESPIWKASRVANLEALLRLRNGAWPRTLAPTFGGGLGFRLAPSGSIWLHLAPSGSIWLHLAPSGSVWLCLAPSGSVWFPVWLRLASGLAPVWLRLAPSGSVWLRLAPSGSFLFRLDPPCSVWLALALSGSVWLHLAPSGAIGLHLAPTIGCAQVSVEEASPMRPEFGKQRRRGDAVCQIGPSPVWTGPQ